MDDETKKSAYHSATYNAAGEAIMSFKPISAIHQSLCAFHAYAHDRTRHVRAHHYCTHLAHDSHQCIIYDSDKPTAKLIGIEYIVSEKIFKSLSQEEKKYWHSHKYEVESGLLQLQPKELVPNAVTDLAEQPAILQLHSTYGKTVHTWQIDVHPDLPLGPPTLMMSYSSPEQIPETLVKERDTLMGMDTEAKRQVREGYLDLSYEKAEGSDEWETSGKAIMFEPREVEVKQ